MRRPILVHGFLRLAAALAFGLVIGAACSRGPAVAKEEYLERGNNFAQQRKFNEATIEYRNALNIDPNFGVDHHFFIPLQGNFTATENIFVGSTPTRLYCNPGSTFRISVGRNSGTGGGVAVVSLSGYYVNVP